MEARHTQRIFRLDLRRREEYSRNEARKRGSVPEVRARTDAPLLAPDHQFAQIYTVSSYLTKQTKATMKKIRSSVLAAFLASLVSSYGEKRIHERPRVPSAPSNEGATNIIVYNTTPRFKTIEGIDFIMVRSLPTLHMNIVSVLPTIYWRKLDESAYNRLDATIESLNQLIHDSTVDFDNKDALEDFCQLIIRAKYSGLGQLFTQSYADGLASDAATKGAVLDVGDLFYPELVQRTSAVIRFSGVDHDGTATNFELEVGDSKLIKRMTQKQAGENERFGWAEPVLSL